MMVSNERREDALIENARLLFELAWEIYAQTWVTFEFINLGGGIGVPYRPDALPDDTYTNHEVDLDIFAKGVRIEYDKIFWEKLGNPKIFMENGRYVTGPAGALIARVRNIAKKYATFVWVDANMSSLMRPGMYGAYHHINVIGKEHLPHDHVYHVTGDLCENNDQFTAGTPRMLPGIKEWDTIAIHTTGAHADAMTFNYNSKLRSPGLLQDLNGDIRIIKNGETEEDLFRNIVPLT